MLRKLARFLLYKVWGWKIEGEFPVHLPKYMAIGGPHTSNWDFILSILARISQGTDIKFIAKQTLFRWPLGFFMRKLGGYPVNRDRTTNFVDYVVNIFNQKDKFAIAITPEGTRDKVDRFKTGFYYIARGANIPVVVVVFDAEHKTYRIKAPFYLGEDLEAAMDKVASYYRGVKGINPAQGVEF